MVGYFSEFAPQVVVTLEFGENPGKQVALSKGVLEVPHIPEDDEPLVELVKVVFFAIQLPELSASNPAAAQAEITANLDSTTVIKLTEILCVCTRVLCACARVLLV